jgi:ketosteroid isomerase-like protein
LSATVDRHPSRLPGQASESRPGAKVFVRGHYRWEVSKSGKPVEAEWCHIFTIDNSKLSGFEEFTDTASFAGAYRG